MKTSQQENGFFMLAVILSNPTRILGFPSDAPSSLPWWVFAMVLLQKMSHDGEEGIAFPRSGKRSCLLPLTSDESSMESLSNLMVWLSFSDVLSRIMKGICRLPRIDVRAILQNKGGKGWLTGLESGPLGVLGRWVGIREESSLAWLEVIINYLI